MDAALNKLLPTKAEQTHALEAATAEEESINAQLHAAGVQKAKELAPIAPAALAPPPAGATAVQADGAVEGEQGEQTAAEVAAALENTYETALSPEAAKTYEYLIALLELQDDEDGPAVMDAIWTEYN